MGRGPVIVLAIVVIDPLPPPIFFALSRVIVAPKIGLRRVALVGLLPLPRLVWGRVGLLLLELSPIVEVRNPFLG